MSLFTLSLPVSADETAFTLTVDGTKSFLRADTSHFYREAYANLKQLVRQLGGMVVAEEDRVQVSLENREVSLLMEEVTVFTSQGLFLLSRPLRARNQELYIAVADVPRFFKQAFQLELVRGGTVQQRELPEITAMPDVQPDTPSPQPVVVEPEVSGVSESGLEIMEPALAPSPADVPVIVLDAGHGGTDTGISYGSGQLEKDITLALAMKLREQLKQQMNATVILTRAQEQTMSLHDRATQANTAAGTLLVSLHVSRGVTHPQGSMRLFIPVREESKSSYLPATARNHKALLDRIATYLEEQETPLLTGRHRVPLKLFRHTSMAGFIAEVGIPEQGDMEFLFNRYAAQLALAITEALEPEAIQ